MMQWSRRGARVRVRLARVLRLYQSAPGGQKRPNGNEVGKLCRESVHAVYRAHAFMHSEN